jgi:predicted chitinase
MSQPRYAYRLGWRSLRAVVGKDTRGRWLLTVEQAKTLARDLGQAMHDFDISTRRRAAMFVAQTAHESGGYRFREEIASGEEYEGRHDLGNVHPGDGKRFKGRTFIQITGRNNYAAVGHALGVDFLRHPEKLAEQKYACKGAAWWWFTHGCNELADQGSLETVTRRINGGLNGLASRQTYYSRARKIALFLIPRRRKP